MGIPALNSWADESMALQCDAQEKRKNTGGRKLKRPARCL